MSERDTHDEWRKLNYWYTFCDVSCRYPVIDDKSVASCVEKFNNGTRFGGFPKIPEETMP